MRTVLKSLIAGTLLRSSRKTDSRTATKSAEFLFRLASRTAAFALLGAALLLTGCAGETSRNPPHEVFWDMRRQDKGKPQSESKFFADGKSSRMPVPGTIARGQLHEDDAYYLGIVDKMYVGKNPEKIDSELLKLGQMRFNTYCSPCHDRTGHGKGTVPARAIGWVPMDLHDPRVAGMNDGEIFDVISHGRRSMPAYRFQIATHDRWAIISYVRALQRSTNGTVDDVPQEIRAELR
jgi:mono/diheme cytochrome c family protein